VCISFVLWFSEFLLNAFVLEYDLLSEVCVITDCFDHWRAQSFTCWAKLFLTWEIITDFTEGTLCPVSVAEGYKTPWVNMSEECCYKKDKCHLIV